MVWKPLRSQKQHEKYIHIIGTHKIRKKIWLWEDTIDNINIDNYWSHLDSNFRLKMTEVLNFRNKCILTHFQFLCCLARPLISISFLYICECQSQPVNWFIMLKESRKPSIPYNKTCVLQEINRLRQSNIIVWQHFCISHNCQILKSCQSRA